MLKLYEICVKHFNLILISNRVCWCIEPKTKTNVFMAKYLECTVVGGIMLLLLSVRVNR